MAITYKGGHDVNNLTPAFNEVNYYFDSSNKNIDGFNYVIDLYLSGTATKVWESRIAPRAGDGYANVFLMGILSALVSLDIPIGTLASNALNSWYKFDLKIGEEMIVAWSYTSYYEYTGGGTFNGYTKLEKTPAGVAHTYQVGDQINVNQTDGGVIKPMLQGLFTVVAVPDAQTIVIDIPFAAVGTGTAVSGSVKYADNRKTITRDLMTKTATVFNGVIDTKLFVGTPSSTFKIISTSVTNELLTDLPSSGFRVKESQDIWVNVANFYATTAQFIYFENSNGDIFSTALGASTSFPIRQIKVAGSTMPALTVVSGTAGLIKVNTDFYSFWVVNGAGAQMSKKYKLEIDRRCNIEDAEVLFLDRKGSFPSYAFQLRRNDGGNIKRESITKSLGELNAINEKWEYKSYEGGSSTTSVEVDKEFTLRTNWITNEMSELFEQLLTSPFTAIKEGGIYYGIQILETNFKTERVKNKPLIRKTITAKYVNQSPVNI